MKLKVNVTQDCINNASKQDGANCPIAIALRNCTIYDLPIDSVEVDSGKSISVATSNGYGYHMVGGMRHDIDAFITVFDDGGRVEPTEFEIDFEEDEPSEANDYD